MTESSDDFAGEPDGFGRLWTPHRMVYIKGQDKPSSDERSTTARSAQRPKRSDEDGLIVARGALVYAVLNLYPYNSGHLMVVPYRHVSDYTDLDADETAEFGAFTQTAMTVLRAVMTPHGFNIGMNQGVGRRCRDRRAPAPARRAAVGRRHELHAGRRAHPGAARTAVRRARRASRAWRLAALGWAHGPARAWCVPSGRDRARRLARRRPADLRPAERRADTIATGGWVLPGFVDAHCHIGLSPIGHEPDPDGQARQARMDRDAGALLLRDAGSPVDNRSVQAREDLPRLIRAGRHIARPKRYIRGLGIEVEPDGLVAEVERQVAAGDGWVKIAADWIDRDLGDLAPVWPDEVLAEAIGRAHELGARVAAHVFGEDALPGLHRRRDSTRSSTARA